MYKNSNIKISIRNFKLVFQLHLLKVKNITNIVTDDFKDLFSNINLQDLNITNNSLFQDYYSQLQFPNNVDLNYHKTLTNFIINNNYTRHISKNYHQKSEIA